MLLKIFGIITLLFVYKIVSATKLHESNEYHGDKYAPINYKFQYGIKDPQTGDHKEHWEERNGDEVKGEYSFDEADGSRRVVEYHADGHNGFNAKVRNIGHPHSK